MGEPTVEEAQWLWKQCGFHSKVVDTVRGFGDQDGDYIGLFAPDGSECGFYPPVDPNNLLKWATTKLKEQGYTTDLYNIQSGRFVAIIAQDIFDIIAQERGSDPGLVLFWAMHKAFEEIASKTEVITQEED